MRRWLRRREDVAGPGAEADVEPGRSPVFTIAGYYGFGNIGDEAILESLLADLRREFPGARFQILCAGYARTACGADVTHVPWTDWRYAVRSVQHCDLLIVGGGGIFNSYLNYGPEDLLVQSTSFGPFIFGLPVLAHMLGKPVYICAIGAGQFNSAEALRHARMAVKLATVCTVRDFASKRVLDPATPADGRIRVTADASFRLENADVEAVASRLEPGLAADLRRTVAVVLRNWSFSGAPGAWEPAIARALKEFAAGRGLRLLFIPFQVSPDTPYDLSNDRSVIERVRTALGEEIDSRVLPVRLSAPEISALLAQCGMVLGMRLHASILAVKNAVAFLGLAYDAKVRSVLARCGLERYVLDPDGITAEALRAALEAVFADGERTRAELKRAAEKMASAAYGNVRGAVDALARGRVVTRPRPDPESLRFFQELALKQTLLLAERDEEARSLAAEVAAHRRALRMAVDQGSFEAALQHADELLAIEPANAEWQYLKAFCLHSLGRDLPLARDCYNRALANGFDEFWVRYHRGQLSLRMARLHEAMVDLERAFEINPAQPELATLLADLRAARSR